MLVATKLYVNTKWAAGLGVQFQTITGRHLQHRGGGWRQKCLTQAANPCAKLQQGQALHNP
jgi:hypothetical protein